MTRPNILLISTDQQRTDSLGCYGGTFVPTPNLDALAHQSTVFDRCYANCPICTPSRASLWTGKSVIGHGVYTLHDLLAKSEILFPEHLRASGYRTALFGKLHVSGRMVECDEPHPNHGFDVYDYALSPAHFDCKYQAYRDWLVKTDPVMLEALQREGTSLGYIPDHVNFSTWVAEATVKFLQEQSGRQPFFCCASFVAPHDPYDNHPEEYLDRVKLGSHEVIDRSPGAERRPEGVKREERGGLLGAISEYSDEELVRMRRSYYASVGFVDTCVGRILRALKRLGLDSNTLIIFTSDHGDMLGQRRLLGKGAYFYDPCVRVPMLIREPGGREGGRSSAVVQLHDIAATVLSAAGCDQALIGKAMPDSLDLRSGNGHPCVFGVYRNAGINREKKFWEPAISCTMVRSARYKLTLYHAAGSGVSPEGELYDMVGDPDERLDLWNDSAHANTRIELMGLMADWLAREDAAAQSARGMRVFPSAKHSRQNNPIRSSESRPAT